MKVIMGQGLMNIGSIRAVKTRGTIYHGTLLTLVAKGLANNVPNPLSKEREITARNGRYLLSLGLLSAHRAGGWGCR